MTSDERFEAYLKKQERKKEKERAKKKEEREKRRVRGYKKYLAEKHREMAKRKKEEEREKEKRRKEREKLREAEKKKKNKGGRPKKRGPKKKRKYVSRKKVVRPPRPRKDYKIVFCLNGRQRGYYDVYSELTDASEAVNMLLEESKKVIYPRRTISGGKESIDEILLLKKNRGDDDEVTILRDQFGRLVEQRTNKPNWNILDKFRYDVEETFWVYGYDPKRERKTFPWIYDNIIIPATERPDEMVRVLLYLNKIIFKYDDGSMDIVFCKDMNDSIRFYNKLYEIREGSSNKVMFIGSYSTLGPKRKALEKELMEKTGWDIRQIQKRKTKK